jgi:hypothetical protein
LGNTAEAKNWEFLAPTGCRGVFAARISTSDNSTLALPLAKLLIAKGQLPNTKYHLPAKLQSQYSKCRTNKASFQRVLDLRLVEAENDNLNTFFCRLNSFEQGCGAVRRAELSASMVLLDVSTAVIRTLVAARILKC